MAAIATAYFLSCSSNSACKEMPPLLMAKERQSGSKKEQGEGIVLATKAILVSKTCKK